MPFYGDNYSSGRGINVRWIIGIIIAIAGVIGYYAKTSVDPKTVNAFALPGGQVFITRGLLEKLHNEAELAGVLGHETGHVIERHSAQQMAKSQLGQSIVTGVAVGGSGNRDNGYSAAMIANFVNQMKQLSFSREDETQADTRGLQFMSEAGYDPRAMLGVMKVLSELSRS